MPVGLKAVDVMWVVHTPVSTHILNNREQYGKMEHVTDMKDEEKRRIMNITKIFYIYL